MADEANYVSRTDNKRKYDDQTSTTPISSGPRRPTGFSAPITSLSPPDSANTPPPPSYNSVPPPVDEIQAAKQRVQEIAARIFSNAEAKRPRNENGTPTDDPNDKGFSYPPPDLGRKPSGFSNQAGFSPSPAPAAYGFQQGPSKKIDVPNGKVGVIIGKGGETIKYLQLQSGAKIQVTRDMDADPHSQTRLVELVGTSEQISKAEQLITEVLSESESGGSGQAPRRFTGQPGAEQFTMKVPNNKVGLVIGKGGETIKNMQANSGARIQLIPLHLPPGDTSTERNLYIDGTQEQIEAAKQLVNEVIGDNRVRNSSMGGGFSQQGYRPPRPPTSWAPPGPPQTQQSGYGYGQPGAPPPYSQTPYGGYPPQQASGWDQNSAPQSQQTSQGGGYDYYSQQPQQPPHGGPSTPADNSGYNYGQPPASGYGQQQEDYTAGGYHAPASQPGYSQQPGYDQSQGYSSASTYAAPTHDGVPPAYGSQAPPPQDAPPAGAQQGYTGQQPSATTTPSYPSQQGYGVPPTSQPGYGSQQPTPTGYAQPGYGPPQGQKPPPGQAAYGQTQPPAQTGYPPHSQSVSAQPGYYAPSYGAQPQQQTYGYGESYSGYSQAPPAYSNDNGAGGGGNAHGMYESASAAPTGPPGSGVPKASPRS